MSSKRLLHEKEIEKARLERKWKTVATLVGALNSKNLGGALSPEDIELSCCFYLGEAELYQVLETHFDFKNPYCISTLQSSELEKAFSYLSAAATSAKKTKQKHFHFYQDSQLLLSKYHFIVGDYQQCISHVNDTNLMPFDQMSRRSRIILAESLTCKGFALEKLDETEESRLEILQAYEQAGEIALSICMEEERGNTLKRSGGATSPSSSGHEHLIALMETCLLRPGEILLKNGNVNGAIQNYRTVLRQIETKSTFNIRKVVCRRLAEVLLSFSCPATYAIPSFLNEDALARAGSITMATTPTRNSPDPLTSSSSNSLLKQSKRSSGTLGSNLSEIAFSPIDEVEESVLLLILSEAMLTRNAIAHQTEEEEKEKDILLHEANIILDLLVFAYTRREQYAVLSQSIESVMHLSFGEFHLWYQFGLSLQCSGQYTRSLLVFEQCIKLQPDSTDVLLLCIKICINNLQHYENGIKYSEKVLTITTDDEILASARLAIGMCYNHMALNARSSAEKQRLLQLSLESLIKANDLDPHDTEILFHLGLSQAMSKQVFVTFSRKKSTSQDVDVKYQVNTAIKTVELSLSIDPTALTSLYLLALLLSAEKKHHEALDIVETAINEYPYEFGFHLLNVKLTEKCRGSQAALTVCHKLLCLWNDLCNGPVDSSIKTEVDAVPVDLTKSPSFSMSLPRHSLNESKMDSPTPASMKKVTLPDGTSIDDDSGSIVQSIRMEKALSEAASGITENSHYSISKAIALLAKLWLVTAECFINLGDSTEASGCILEASAIFPLSPDVLYMEKGTSQDVDVSNQRGRLNELQNNISEAKACFESSIAVLSTHKSSLQRLGMIYHDEGDYVIAEKTLRSCILLDSMNHTAWNDLGLILESAGYPEDAANCFVTSLKLEMTSPILSYSTIPRLFKAHGGS